MKSIAVAGVSLLLFALPAFLPAQMLQADYSTYLGGADFDYGFGVAAGADGCAYLTGETESLDFPLRDAYQGIKGGLQDAFVAKLSAAGSSLVYSTYLGGNDYDGGYAAAIDAEGGAYVTGMTYSSDFPTRRSVQSSLGAPGVPDAFVAKLSSSGTDLIYSTYLGGAGEDSGESIALDSARSAYVTGYTLSSQFPTLNAYQASSGGASDIFLAALASAGSPLLFSTYLGGSGTDEGHGVRVDAAHSAYVAGFTGSSTFPTLGPYQGSRPGWYDACLSKFSSGGSALVYSTFLGGALRDEAFALALDPGGCAYLTGWTESTDFPVLNAYQSSFSGGTEMAFVSKFSSTGSALSYSTYLGGVYEGGSGIVVTSGLAACVAGFTHSPDFPLRRPFQSSYGGGYSDAFLSELAPSGSGLVFSSYLGGVDNDQARDVAADPEGRVYLIGSTKSADFPTCNSYQASGNGDQDAFAARFSWLPAERRSHLDYDGDGTSDLAVFRGTSGLWSVRSVTRVYFGVSNDDLVPGDYNGDGTTDVAVFRPSTGLWTARNLTRLYHGSSTDEPVAGDYDGNGTCDVAVYRASAGLWSIRNLTRAYFGASGDIPVPGYYDGGGGWGIAVFRPSTGLWSVRDVTRIYFGSSADEVVPGDYNGAGAWAAAVFRASSGLWSVRDLTRIYFGSSTDRPVPADFNGDDRDDFGVFRDSSGLWAVRNLTRVYFGATGDIPLSR